MSKGKAAKEPTTGKVPAEKSLSRTRGLRRGGPGRRKGTPNKITREIRAAAIEFIEDPTGQSKLLALYRAGKLHHSLVAMFHHYAYGKPAERTEQITPDLLNSLTSEQLQKLAAGVPLIVVLAQSAAKDPGASQPA